MAVASEATDQAQELLASGLAGATPVAADAGVLIAAQDTPKQLLYADEAKGVLLTDQPSAPAQVAKARPRDDCPTGGSKQVLPVAPKDLRVGSLASGC